ncbi:MAG: hypothetical protein FJ102_01970 [Deltaproteobacteria bacterium]|nr:hypothetical protein [Deltaproteobacteria bacterium]
MSPPCAPGDDPACFLPETDVVASAWFFRYATAQAHASVAGNPPEFFREGLGDVLGPWSQSGDATVDHAYDLLSMMEGETEVVPGVAASFTRFLIDEHGKDAFLEFYGTAPADAACPEFESSFESAFGAGTEQLVAQWQGLPDSYRGDAFLYLTECASEPVPASLGAGAVLVEPDLRCDQAELDINRADGVLGAYRTVDVDANAAIHVSLDNRGLSGVQVQGCDDYLEGEASAGGGDAPTTELWANVGTGRYALWFWLSGNAVAEAAPAAAVEVAEPVASEDCASAGTLDVGGSTDVRLEGPTESGLLHFWLDATEDTDLALYAGSFEHGEGLENTVALDAELCAGSCDALACDGSAWANRDLYDVASLPLATGEPLLLRLSFEPGSHYRVDLEGAAD